MIGIAGCVAQAEGEEIVRRAPVVDLVFGPQSYHRLPDLVKMAQTKKKWLKRIFQLKISLSTYPSQKKRNNDCTWPHIVPDGARRLR